MQTKKRWLHKAAALTLMLGVVLAMSVTSAFASATVRMMPDRDALKATPIVVWGNTTHPNGSLFTLDFGDGSPVVSGSVTDRTYINATHAYNTGIFTASLTVAGDTETVKVTVFDPAALTADNLRAIRINMAIEDGLRFLYFSQFNRTGTYTTLFTSWGSGGNDSSTMSYSSLAVLALENHGHHVTDDPNKDIYQQVVQRGLNFLFNGLIQVGLTVEPAGNPCVAVPAPLCTGLATTGTNGYATAVTALAIAGSNAMANTVGAGIGSANSFFVVGKSYSEVLQRLVNAIAWGQSDPAFGAGNQGGWRYGLDGDSDASAIGWNLLALLDAQATGRTIPAFIASELNVVTTNTTVTPVAGQSSLLYATGWSRGSLMRAGVRLQALFFMGVPVGDPKVTASVAYINAAWNGFHPNGEEFSCGTPSALGVGSPPGSPNNRGCAYAMFQVFKGLKLYGIPTLPSVLRPDDDWHKEYQDYLIANQQSPNTPGGGQWFPNQMFWSCCATDMTGITALAELMLSPTALILPSTLTLSPATDENPVGTSHTVTAKATTAGGGVVPGATVTFTVLSGPNAGKTGTGTTNAQGEATFTYTDTGGPAGGTDKIQAKIGTLESNIVDKVWKPTNQPPTVNAGPDQNVAADANCKGNGTLTATGNDPDGDTLTYTWTGPFGFSATGASVTFSGLPLGTHTFTVTVSDGKGGTATDSVNVTVEDKTPPTLNVPAAQVVEQTSLGGSTVVLTPAASDNCSIPTITSNAPANNFYPLGTTTVTFTATDAAGNSTTQSTTVTVKDTTAPTITSALTATTLWPPNHDMVPVGSISVSDICDAKPGIGMSITQDEPLNTTGDGNFQPDASVTFAGSTASINLRRERRGNADGRVYLLKTTATDASGNTKFSCSVVTVSKSQSNADKTSVANQAAAALAACQATGAVLPYSSTVGPIVGPKQ